MYKMCLAASATAFVLLSVLHVHRMMQKNVHFCEDKQLAKRGLNKRGRPRDFISNHLIFSVTEHAC